MAQAVQEAGGAAYVFRFDRVREGFDAIGAYHGAELPYVFHPHDPWMPTNAIDQQVTNALVNYWLAFLISGSLNKSQSSDSEITGAIWPAWTNQQQALVIADEVSTLTHPDAALCEFLNATQVAGARP